MKSSISKPSYVKSRSSISKSSKNTSSSAHFHVKLGSDIHSGERFGLTKDQKETHTHIIGSSGSGKSKLMEYLIRQDMMNPNCGACLIDPHGSLYDDLVAYASHNHPRLAKRIVLFNPLKDVDHVMGFNPVSNDTEKMDYYLDTLIGSCLKAWGQNNPDLTPRIQNWLNNIFHTLMVNDLTLLEAVPLISTKPNNKQREQLLSKVSDERIIQDWENFEKLTSTQRQNMMEGAANRLGKFLRSEAIRLIIGQQNHTLDMQQCMREGKIVLVNLYGGDKISADNCRLIGSLLVSDIFNSAQLRNPQEKLKPFYVYIDEFAEFISRDIARALDQTRKRKVFMTLAHQHLSQLEAEDKHLYGSILTNCKTKIVFGGLSQKDSELMTSEIQTGFHNLKSLKHAQYRIRERHIEETREVVSKNSSVSHGRSEGESFTEGESFGENRSTSTGESTGESTTKGQSRTRTKGKSQGITQSITSGIVKGVVQGVTEGVSAGLQKGRAYSSSASRSEGESFTQGTSKGRTGSETESRSSSRGTGENWGSSEGENWSDGSSNSHTYGERSGSTYGPEGSYNMNRGDSSSRTSGSSHSRGGTNSRTQGHSRSESHTEGSSQARGWSEGESVSEGRSRSLGTSESESTNESENRSESSGKSSSRSQSESQGQGRSSSSSSSFSQSEGKSSSHTKSRGQSQTQTEGESRSKSSSHARSTGTSESHSEGESIAVVPFLRPEEVQELASETFWNLSELKHMAEGRLKNLETAEAFIKIGANAPVHCKIDKVVSPVYDHRRSPVKVERFQKKVIEAHPQFYSEAQEVRIEYQKRQQAKIGAPLNFEKIETQLIAEDIEGDDGFTTI